MKYPIFVIFLFVFINTALSECVNDSDVRFLHSLLDNRDFETVLFKTTLLKKENPDCTPAPSLDLIIGKAYYHTGRFYQLRKLFHPHLALENQYRSFYMESFLLDFHLQGRLDSISALLNQPALFSSEEETAYKIAIHYLENNPRAASNLLAQSDTLLSTSAKTISDIQTLVQMGFKSPGLSAVYSIVPGIGYLYAGDWGTSLYSLALVSGCYAISAYYFNYDGVKRGMFFLSIGAIFHVSNIYGGYKAAKKVNEKRKITFLKMFHQLIFP
ncbi:MAG: hypothetical protein HQK83_04725 [Fibrobacteria bacterium]|nr:hypothetical protein [Fibrobacteria bacterium]